MVTIEPPKEQTVDISCFAWVNMNRIAIGHTDGTVALWSVYPCQALHRHPVHVSPIIDIASGYPSHPFVVATIPMGGVSTITDLSRPNQETSYNPNLGVCVQQHLLAWCEVLRGFVAIWPSAFAGSASIGFGQLRVYAQGRYVMTLDAPPTCLAMGAAHPYLLAGTADGSLWALNIMRKAYSHREVSTKLKVFQHEYRAAEPLETSRGDDDDGDNDDNDDDGGASGRKARVMPRGKCRILYGFLPERNSHPKTLKQQKAGSKATQKKGKKGKGKGKGKAKTKKGKARARGGGSEYEDGGAEDDEEEDEEEDEEDLSDAMGEPEGEGEGPGAATQPLVVHDPQTRITSVAWNPNARFSWWAAAAMGSGLVRVMDLGVDPPETGSSDDSDHGDDDHSSDNASPDEEAGDGDGDEEAEADVEMIDRDDDIDMATVPDKRSRKGSTWKTIN